MRNPQQMKRANGYFSVLIEEPLCILVVSQQGHIDIHMHTVCVSACACSLLFFCFRSVSPIVCLINMIMHC